MAAEVLAGLAKQIMGPHLSLEGAHLTKMGRLREVLVEQHRPDDPSSNLLLAEKYRGPYGKCLRIYFKPNEDQTYVPTVVIGPKEGFNKFANHEIITPLPYIDGVRDEHNVSQIYLSHEELLQIPLCEEVLSGGNLAYGWRKTSHVRAETIEGEHTKVQVFRHFRDPSVYAALVTHRDEREHLSPDASALTITNSDWVMNYRRAHTWTPAT